MHINFHMANMEAIKSKLIMESFGSAWPFLCRLPFCSDSREPRYALAPPKLNLYGTESTCILGAEMRFCVG
jgi:hypothetical protein